LVSFLPETLAPNTITLFGFIFATAPVIMIMLLFGTDFQNEKENPV